MHNALHNGLARYLSPDQLEALRAARVGIAGAGGLGANAALMLARSGVGKAALAIDTGAAKQVLEKLIALTKDAPAV